ncbi:MAG: transposase [Chloroflexi bacterium]|nr:transposase [Chloroflexota bacterium]
MITKLQYVEFLISTIANYTGTHLAEHLDQVSHDTITDFLQSERLTAHHLWELVHALIVDSPEAFLIADDSVQDKRYSRFIELVRRQYSGAEHGLVRGIGVVNLVHSSGKPGEFYPIDYRIYDPDGDGKTKNDHFREMLVHAIADKLIKARTVLFDSWYAGADNLKLIHRLGLIFFTTLKENRLVSLSKEEGYLHLDQIEWTPERLQHGVIVKLKEVPFKVRLFKLVATNGDIDWVITNGSEETLTAQVAQNANDVRWQVEELHRGIKQLTGSEKCQCRKARSQRNHLACCYHAWLSLKVIATQLNKTLYEVKTDLLRDYLRAELRNPHVPAFQSV